MGNTSGDVVMPMLMMRIGLYYYVIITVANITTVIARTNS